MTTAKCIYFLKYFNTLQVKNKMFLDQASANSPMPTDFITWLGLQT